MAASGSNNPARSIPVKRGEPGELLLKFDDEMLAIDGTAEDFQFDV